MPLGNARTDTVLNNLKRARARIEDPKNHLMGSFGAFSHAKCSAQALAETMGSEVMRPTVQGSDELRLLASVTTADPTEYIHSGARTARVCAENNQGHDRALAMFDNAIAARKKETRRAVR